MSAEHLARFAGLFADRSRAAICLALLDGRAWTATELAAEVGVAPSTMSEHLTLLVGGGLLREVRQGRHRYLRLAGPDAAQLVEDLAAVAGRPARPVGLRKVRASERLAAGRTCYDHLAGDLGVAIHEALLARRYVSDEPALTPAGRTWFTALLGPDALRRSGSRPLVRTCLDWTRRVPHLGGAVGAALCGHALREEWVVRSAQDRSVTLTTTGHRAFGDLLGL